MRRPQNLRAAVLVELKRPLVLAELSLPEALEPGQVLVAIHFSGICGSQLGEIDGVKGPDRFLPHLLGHEGSGTVIDTGPGVRHVSAGDKVVLHWTRGRGIESVPPRYGWKGKSVNAGWVTTFNDYAVVSENRLTVIPPDADMEIAALFGCAVLTGFGVIVNNAALKIGESIVIFGAGGIGLSVVQAAALTSAYPIIAVDIYDSKLALAKRMGATHLVNGKAEDAGDAIRRALDGRPLDVFIDNTGIPAVIELGYSMTDSDGRVVLVGVPKVAANVTIHTLPLHFGKRVFGTAGGDAAPHEDIPRYFELLKRGKLDLGALVTDRFPLSRINEAIAAVREGRVAGRCLVEFAR